MPGSLRSLQRIELIRSLRISFVPHSNDNRSGSCPELNQLCFSCASQFIKVLERELDAIEKEKEAFIRDFSEVSLSRLP